MINFSSMFHAKIVIIYIYVFINIIIVKLEIM